MKTGLTLTQLAQEIERRADVKKDFIAPASRIVMDDNAQLALIDPTKKDNLYLNVNKVAHAQLAEDVLPVDVARLELRRRRVAAIRIADRAPDAEPAFGEIEAVADRAADAVVLAPLDEVGGHAALHDEILDEMPHLVVHKCRANRRLVPETLAQPARGVVLAAALPRCEMPRRAHASLAGVQTKHHLAKGNLVKGTMGLIA